jgi:hypothetical protein
MNPEIKIDKDVPIPSVGRKGRRTRYPFPGMGVGDSFYCEADFDEATPGIPSEATIALIVKRLHSASYCWARNNNNGWLFAVRRDSMGARIWRIK